MGGPSRRGSDGQAVHFKWREAELERLREKNRRRARLIHHLRAIIAVGERPVVELLIDLACRLNGLQLLEELAERYAAVDPVILRMIGGSGFPPPSVPVIGG